MMSRVTVVATLSLCTVLAAGCTNSGSNTTLPSVADSYATNLASGSAHETVLHFFKGPPDGTLPNVGRLVFDRAGNLYGATNTGGSGKCKFRAIVTGCGVVFELTRGAGHGWSEHVIYSFKNIEDGAGPYSTLTVDPAGDIYGVTMAGGNRGCVPLFWVYHGCGTAFELTHSGKRWKKSILHVFSGATDGGNPVTSLVRDSAGNLYGTAHCGGAVYSCYTEGSGAGVFFVLQSNHGAWSEKVLFDFGQPSNGSFPAGDLTPKGTRTIYGATVGSVYEMTRSPGSSTWRERTLWVFPSPPYGDIFNGGIVFDGAGNLYGTTYGGGDLKCRGSVSGCGVVFELMRAPSGLFTEIVLHAFSGGSDGSLPDAGLAIDSSGRLYGTTTNGGDLRCNNGGGCGVAFVLTPHGTGSTYRVMHAFKDDATDGGMPLSAPTLDSAGNIYGSTEFGGPGPNLGKGTAFELGKPLHSPPTL